MPDRQRPYLFYDVAVSICDVCFRRAEGKILFEDGKVLLRKRCAEHGWRTALVADEVARGVEQFANREVRSLRH